MVVVPAASSFAPQLGVVGGIIGAILWSCLATSVTIIHGIKRGFDRSACGLLWAFADGYGQPQYRGFESLPLHTHWHKSTKQYRPAFLDGAKHLKSRGILPIEPAPNDRNQAFELAARSGNRKDSDTGLGMRRREWSPVSFDGRSTRTRGSGNSVESKSAQIRASSRRRGI